MQNDSVFATSIAQLKPPQNRIPPIAPTITSVATEKRAVGPNSTDQVRAKRLLRGGSVMVSPSWPTTRRVSLRRCSSCRFRYVDDKSTRDVKDEHARAEQ